MVLSSPAVANGVVYIGGGNTLYALGVYALNASPTTSYTLPVIIGVIVAVVIVIIMVFLMLKKRLKTKMMHGTQERFGRSLKTFFVSRSELP